LPELLLKLWNKTADQIMSLLSAMLSMDSLEMEALSVLVDV
jgi:hypothetical protein